MHRSGTTVAAAIVEGLGVDFGPAQGMMEPDPNDNPGGYLEQEAIMDLNEELLEAYRGAWWRPPRLFPGWERARRLRDTRSRATAALSHMYRDGRWGFKDPRFSFTLPFWRSIVGEMDYVVCIRDPAEVAASLLSRFRVTFPDTAGAKLDSRALGRLWLRYTRAAMANTQAGRRMIVCHADVLRDGPGQAARIAEFLGGTAEPDELAAVVDPRLWRNRPGGLEAVQVPARARRMYERLAAAAQDGR